MSLHPTNRDAQTGGATPHELAAQQDIEAISQDAQSYDDTLPALVTVKRTAGRSPQPADKLHDAVIYDEGAGRGIRVEIVKGGDR